MVKDAVGAVVVGVGPTNDANNGKILAICPRDGVKDAEPADGEGHRACADASRPSVTVSRVPGIYLVAAAHVGEPRLGDQVI